MEQKPLLPTNDYVFKKVFGEHLTVLGNFLKAVLDLPDEEYQGLEVLNPELLPEHIADKHCILDIKLHTRSGETIDIEIQVEYQQSIWKRIQYYTAKLLAEQGKKGGEYGDIPRVISILITDFALIKENAEYHHCFRLYDEKRNVRFKDSIEINVLEIPKAREADGSQLNDWMRFFRAKEEEEFEMLAQTNPAIAEAWGVIRRLSADETARAVAESREKGRRDVASAIGDARRDGRQEGLREGLREGKWEVAKNLLRKRMSAADIADVTGLPLNEIIRLAAELPR